MFLKIKRGKGAKFRRVRVPQRLRREIISYINKNRPDSEAPNVYGSLGELTQWTR